MNKEIIPHLILCFILAMFVSYNGWGMRIRHYNIASYYQQFFA
jgi:hypothetical protein